MQRESSQLGKTSQNMMAISTLTKTKLSFHCGHAIDHLPQETHNIEHFILFSYCFSVEDKNILKNYITAFQDQIVAIQHRKLEPRFT